MIPDDFKGPKSGGEIAIHPNDQFLYTSNRGHDSIAIFHIERSTGRLTEVDRMSTLVRMPRNFAIDPSGESLLAAGQDSSAIALFWIDSASGKLTPFDRVTTPVPVSLVFTRAS